MPADPTPLAVLGRDVAAAVRALPDLPAGWAGAPSAIVAGDAVCGGGVRLWLLGTHPYLSSAVLFWEYAVDGHSTAVDLACKNLLRHERQPIEVCPCDGRDWTAAEVAAVADIVSMPGSCGCQRCRARQMRRWTCDACGVVLYREVSHAR